MPCHHTPFFDCWIEHAPTGTYLRCRACNERIWELQPYSQESTEVDGSFDLLIRRMVADALRTSSDQPVCFSHPLRPVG